MFKKNNTFSIRMNLRKMNPKILKKPKIPIIIPIMNPIMIPKRLLKTLYVQNVGNSTVLEMLA